MFKNGELDAIATYSPFIEKAEPFGHIIASTASLTQPIFYDGLFMHEKKNIPIP